MTTTSTDSETPVSTGGSESARNPRSGRETGPEDSSLQPAPVTARDWLRNAVDGLHDYWVPPTILTGPAPSIKQLANYAHRGGWTTKHGRMRSLGIVWWRLIGKPVTVACRTVEWFAQRPGRAIVAIGLWWLFVSTTPGAWIDNNLVHPALNFLF